MAQLRKHAALTAVAEQQEQQRAREAGEAAWREAEAGRLRERTEEGRRLRREKHESRKGARVRTCCTPLVGCRAGRQAGGVLLTGRGACWPAGLVGG